MARDAQEELKLLAQLSKLDVYGQQYTRFTKQDAYEVVRKFNSTKTVDKKIYCRYLAVEGVGCIIVRRK